MTPVEIGDHLAAEWEIELRVRGVACPICGRAAGRNCVGRSRGPKHETFHSCVGRYRAAARAGLVLALPGEAHHA